MSRRSLTEAPPLPVRPYSFEQVIESRSATPEPAGQPRNDTDVIRHGLAAPVKRWNGISYHPVTNLRRVGRRRVAHTGTTARAAFVGRA
ncbi:hypothetical protein FZ046_13195 [Mycolicibacterium grossiae]|nr:hypothetical protein FZ046_13195 [Mycolicibacterium grossiae]